MRIYDTRNGRGRQEENDLSACGHAQAESRNYLEQVLRDGAQTMLQKAIEWEVQEYLIANESRQDKTGHRLVVRNGRRESRQLQTGIGDIEICQPRINDRRKGKRFISNILPPYARRAPSIEALLPALYLAGVSTNNFATALQAILGESAKGLSANSIVRLKDIWEKEYRQWAGRNLSGREYIYWWVDGIYFNVRLTDERPCLLVVIGALRDGTKELLAIWDGQRESKLSWQELLSDLKRRGISQGPRLAIGDGALGFWAAIEEEYPKVDQQRCWVHKTANILDKLPKKIQPSAKELIHQMYMAPTKAEAFKAYDEFMKCYQAKYPKACECLAKDKDELFTFYNYPAEHWVHIRTTNVIESAFATVRHRTRQTKGCGSRVATLTMVYKLGLEAEKGWIKLRGHNLIIKVMEGIRFKDGLEEAA
ncbi:MAG: IS256 family transposase [Planctomycetota bacterium]|nr:IS256 family transposase [Planctomycetota bacterium]